MVKTDPVGREMLAKYKVPMPNQNVSDHEIREYLAYFKWADANIQPKGKTQPAPAACASRTRSPRPTTMA